MAPDRLPQSVEVVDHSNPDSGPSPLDQSCCKNQAHSGILLSSSQISSTAMLHAFEATLGSEASESFLSAYQTLVNILR